MPASAFDKLIDPHVCIVLAYAQAGLGHLRVTRALYKALPEEANPILLPDISDTLTYFHRLSSTNSIAKRIFEWSQYGWAEDFVSKTYRWALQKDTKTLKTKLIEVLKQQVELPHTLLVVATHFGVAHQLSHIKTAIEKQANVRVRLIVQVTDDSPQKMWYVPRADLLFCPSEETRLALQEYGRKEKLPKSHLVTKSYPVSPTLMKRLDHEDFSDKIRQTNPDAKALIHIAVPISGAAVGMSYHQSLMNDLHKLEPRVRFHVIAKRTLFTLPFLRSWAKRHYINLYESHSDRQITELYEEAYQRVPISFEITKPSEQTFKALLSPASRGGVIMLFTNPVGRQEYDNLNFLRRHNYIPTGGEESRLYDVLNLQQHSPQSLPLRQWRGFELHDDPKIAAKWISRGISLRIFHSMLHWKHTHTSEETQPTGSLDFWKEVGKLL